MAERASFEERYRDYLEREAMLRRFYLWLREFLRFGWWFLTQVMPECWRARRIFPKFVRCDQDLWG